jgi:membrane protein YqaA with SNARE-associated domain
MGLVEQISDKFVRGESGQRRLALASFLEATIVPIPLETVVAPLMAAHPGRAYRIAVAILVGCILGALLFYLVAQWLYDPVVAPALDLLGLQDNFERARDRMSSGNLFWAVFLVSVTPVPFQLATLGAGATGGSLISFMLAVTLSRAIRYFGLAYLSKHFGPPLVERLGGRGPLLLRGTVILLLAYVAYRALLA